MIDFGARRRVDRESVEATDLDTAQRCKFPAVPFPIAVSSSRLVLSKSCKRIAGQSLLAFALLQAGSAVVAYPFHTQSVKVTDYGTIMRDGIATADFSGDGIDEIFVTSASQAPMLIALTQELLTLRPARLLPLPAGSDQQTQLHVWQGTNGPILVAVTASSWSSPVSTVQLYAGWPLTAISTYNIPTGLSGVAIGDVEGDGIAELVAGIGTQTQVFRLSDGLFQWSLPIAASDIVIANLDADPASELVFATTPGVVYDGGTRLQEWSYPDGFGAFLAAGSIGSGGAPGFVGARDWGYFTTFRSSPWSPVWDYSEFDIDAIAVANLDGVGADEIIEGDGQWGSVNIVDSQTRTLRLGIPHQGHGIAALAAVKTSTAAGKDIIFAPNSSSSGPSLSVVRSSNGASLYELRSDPGGIGATSIGDIDADGQVELVVASSGSEPARIRVFNRDSGVEEWVSPGAGNANDPFYMGPKFLFQTQLDADPALELVAAGSGTITGRILVLDGATKAVQLQIGDYTTSRPLDSRSIVGAVLVDYNADNFKELAIVTQPTSSGENGVRVHVFSLLTGAALWESVRIGQGFAQAKGIHLQQSAGHDVLVAALPEGLRAFGVQSQLLEWTHTAPIHRAVYLADAPGGAEILIENSVGAVTHLDAETRAVRRNYTLSGPSTAIAPVLGAPYFIAAHPGALNLMSLTGTVLGSATDAVGIAGFSPLSVRQDGSRFDVLTGTGFGFVHHKLDPDGVFAGGFEAD